MNIHRIGLYCLLVSGFIMMQMCGADKDKLQEQREVTAEAARETNEKTLPSESNSNWQDVIDGWDMDHIYGDWACDWCCKPRETLGEKRDREAREKASSVMAKIREQVSCESATPASDQQEK